MEAQISSERASKGVVYFLWCVADALACWERGSQNESIGAPTDLYCLKGEDKEGQIESSRGTELLFIHNTQRLLDSQKDPLPPARLIGS